MSRLIITSLNLFLILIHLDCIAQELNPKDDEAIIHFTVSNMEGVPIKSKVSFSNPEKSYTFQTNEKGKADFTVKVGLSYRIQVVGSLTYYDYEITDFPGQELNLELQFEESGDLGDAATANQALLMLSALNPPEGIKIEIVNYTDKSIVTSSKSDTIQTPLPINNKFQIIIAGYKIKNDLIEVGDKPYNVLYYTLYFSNKGEAELIKAEDKVFFFIDFKNIYTKKPQGGEEITLESKNGKKKYKNITNSNGNCLFKVEKDDTYYVHLKFAKSVLTTAVEKKDELCIYHCDLAFPSSAEFHKRQKEDSIRLAKREEEFKRRMEATKKEKEDLKTYAEREAKTAMKELKKDPKYFKKKNNVVCEILYRLRNRWKNKLIVTDLTGSMYPYMKQVLIWHCLKSMINDQKKYVFFNDGNFKDTRDKKIGETGGLYYTDGKTTDDVVSEMTKTMKNGAGGDGPENDLEALLFAQSKRKGKPELILIADNFSNVRDLELINELNIPVRIILCGTDWGIHQDYLEIAWKTKGSIHTIEEDIMQLEKIADGKSLTIGGKEYVLSGGKFFKKDK